MTNLEVLVKEHEKEIENLNKRNAELEFYKSLVNSVKLCGGSADWITSKTTLRELSDKLAINDVRFHVINNHTTQRGV